MTILRIPPIIGQNWPTLPDGQLDRTAAYDCGETCAAMAIRAINGIYLAPGCIREALGDPSGYTDEAQIQWVINRMVGMHAEPTSGDWQDMQNLRMNGRYVIALGMWLTGLGEHWMLFYHATGTQLVAHDPWYAQIALRDEGYYNEQYSKSAVAVTSE
jgi:hypothetical protein